MKQKIPVVLSVTASLMLSITGAVAEEMPHDRAITNLYRLQSYLPPGIADHETLYLSFCIDNIPQENQAKLGACIADAEELAKHDSMLKELIGAAHKAVVSKDRAAADRSYEEIAQLTHGQRKLAERFFNHVTFGIQIERHPPQKAQ